MSSLRANWRSRTADHWAFRNEFGRSAARRSAARPSLTESTSGTAARTRAPARAVPGDRLRADGDHTARPTDIAAQDSARWAPVIKALGFTVD